MAKRKFLMLGQPYKPENKKHKLAGLYMSEKLDGVRCFWDGGVSRGCATGDVPWAGLINPKTGQPKDKVKPVATGLWSRYGNPIMAPEWFLNNLPCMPLDGELYTGRGNFQRTCSIIKKDVPIDEEWEEVQFAVFSTPDFDVVMQDGLIKNNQQWTEISHAKVKAFVEENEVPPDWRTLREEGGVPFSSELANLAEWIDASYERVFVVNQVKLPNDEAEAQAIMQKKFKEVIEGGGEGVIVRRGDTTWKPKRVHEIIKVKGSLDGEGVVTGFTSGRKTTKGSKLRGLIGAVILDYNGERLEMSGFTNEERVFANEVMTQYAVNNPGEDMPEHFQGKHFKVGQEVTFKYRELSDGGIPKEARYDRIRDDR